MEGTEQMLCKLFDKIAKENQYENYDIKLKSIPTGGASYSSLLYHATISSPDKEDLQLFAKVAAISEKTRETIPDYIYYSERYVYCELMKKFKIIEDNCEVQPEDRFVVSKLYGFNTNMFEETLVLENLMDKGYTTYDRLKSVDWSYASKAVEVLAKFHALAIAYSENYPEECQKLYEELDGKLDRSYESMDKLLLSGLKVALEVTREENKDRLTKYFENNSSCKLLDFMKSKRRKVLIYGDYRQSNLMHKTNDDGSVHIIPVDFQTFQPGCMVSDLIFFIFTSTDAEFRALYYEKLIEHYYSQLCRSLRTLRLNPEELFSREDFDYEYEKTLPYGLVLSVLFLPIITVDPEDALNAQDDNFLENIVSTKTTALYPKRLNGVIDDYIRWGII